MTIGTLWGDIAQRQTKVILSVAALNDLDLVRPVSSFDFNNKPKEFVDKFLYSKIPAFEHSEGWTLHEGASIARYLCDIGETAKLLGSNAKESAFVDQWVHFAEHEIGVPTQDIIYLIFLRFVPFNKETLDKYLGSLHRALTYLESHLATCASGYVALDRLTLADLVIASVIFNARRVSLGTAEVAKYPNIFAHFSKVTEDERVKRFWKADKWPLVDVALTEPTKFPWV